MQLRKKVTILAVAALPLAGLASFVGVQTATAGVYPLLTCEGLSGGGANQNAITFTDASNATTGIYLNSNAGATDALLANAFNGNTTITINNLAITGQTLTVAGFTGTYTVANDSTPGSGVNTPDVVTLSTPLAGNTAKYGETKAKGVVTVNPTDGTNATELFDPNVTENVNLALNTCTSSHVAPGDFAPTEASVVATSPGTNSAVGLEKNPANLDGTVNFPPIGAGYVQPVPTSVGFDAGTKANTINLTDFGITYTKGVVTGDYATTKAELQFLALGGMTVCSAGELQAIADGTGVDMGVIAQGANPLVVCDGGSNPAFPSASGLGEILAAETAPGGTTTYAYDGTQVGAIYAIQVDANGNNVL